MQILTMDIDPGEAAAIILALENNIKLILIDDARARKVATYNNLTPIGTLGLLIKAKEKKLIKEVKGYMDQLILNNIHIRDTLYKDVLAMVNVLSTSLLQIFITNLIPGRQENLETPARDRGRTGSGLSYHGQHPGPLCLFKCLRQRGGGKCDNCRKYYYDPA